MAAIAVGWLAGRKPVDDDVPKEDAASDDQVPPSSSIAPPTSSTASFSPVPCTMSIGEAHSHYVDMVRDERQEKFQEAQNDAAYKHYLLQEHL